MKKRFRPVVVSVLLVLLAGACGVWVHYRGNPVTYARARAAERVEETLPDLPVAGSLRKSLLGKGLVVQLKNESIKTLPLKITLMNPTFGKTNTFERTLLPSKLIEIGHAEGWTGASGDLVKIESSGYKTKRAHLK